MGERQQWRLRYPIVTERLLLRPKSFRDVDAMLAVFGDRQAVRYLAGVVRDRVQTRAIVESDIEHERVHGFSMWAAVLRASGDVIGDAGLQLLEGGPEVEVGYRLAPAHWGSGYATEAARACVRVGLSELGLRRIVAVAVPANVRSRRVMEKVGMRFEREGVFYGRPGVMYVIEAPA